VKLSWQCIIKCLYFKWIPNISEKSNGKAKSSY
jgi:hypothetical protein